MKSWSASFAPSRPMTCATNTLRSLIHFGRGAYVPARMAIGPCAFDGAIVWLGAKALSRQLGKTQ